MIANSLAKFARRFGSALAEGPVGRTVMPGPLELFQAEQKGKLSRFLTKSPVMGSAEKPGLIDSYFSGRNMVNGKEDFAFGEADAALAKRRTRGAYAIGGLLVANTLGIDPFGATSGVNNLAMLGAHATVGSSLYAMGGKSRVAGMAYLGAAALNTFRSGDNAGPM